MGKVAAVGEYTSNLICYVTNPWEERLSNIALLVCLDHVQDHALDRSYLSIGNLGVLLLQIDFDDLHLYR